MDVLQAALLALVTALATGLGVLPMYWLGMGSRGIGVPRPSATVRSHSGSDDAVTEPSPPGSQATLASQGPL